MSKSGSHFRASFIAGLLATVPLVVTAAISIWVFDKLTGLIPSLLKQVPVALVQELLNNPLTKFGIRAISLLVMLGAVCLIGMIARNVVGHRIIHMLEKLIARVPMLGTIYGTIKKIGQAILTSGEGETFRKVALIEYPRKGIYAIGFVTADAAVECRTRTGEDLVSVFVPTTPNPTSGFLLLLPRREVQILSMSVPDGMRLIISGGVVHPTAPPLPPPEPESTQQA